MGHNRAGEKRKARKKRRKREEARFNRWAKEWSTKFATPISVVYMTINGEDQLYHYDKPKETHFEFPLPQPMMFQEAVSHCHDKLCDMAKLVIKHSAQKEAVNTDR